MVSSRLRQLVQHLKCDPCACSSAPASSCCSESAAEGRTITLPLVSFELPYEDAVRSNNGALTLPMLLTEPRHHRMMARIDKTESRLLGWLDTWPALQEDFAGARGTVLEVLYTKTKNDPVYGHALSVEAVGIGAFAIVQIWEEDEVVYAEAQFEEGDPILSVLEYDEADEHEQRQKVLPSIAAEQESHRFSSLFVPTHSTCTTRNVVVNLRTQYHEKDRWGQGHLFAFTVEVHNNTDDRVRIMRRRWWVRAADGSVTEYGGRGMLEGLYPEIPSGESCTVTSLTTLPTRFGTMSGHFEVVVMERKMDLWVMGTEKFDARCECCGLSADGRPVRVVATGDSPEDVS